MSRWMADWMKAAMDAGWTVEQIDEDSIRIRDPYGVAILLEARQLTTGSLAQHRVRGYLERLRPLSSHPEDWPEVPS